MKGKADELYESYVKRSWRIETIAVRQGKNSLVVSGKNEQALKKKEKTKGRGKCRLKAGSCAKTAKRSRIVKCVKIKVKKGKIDLQKKAGQLHSLNPNGVPLSRGGMTPHT